MTTANIDIFICQKLYVIKAVQQAVSTCCLYYAVTMFVSMYVSTEYSVTYDGYPYYL